MPQKPEILNSRLVAESELFQIEQLDLRFSNGELRSFERIKGRQPTAVMIAALLDEETILLVREYRVGSHRYELGLPKGLVQDDEPLLNAANRELMEEIGYGANKLQLLKPMSTAPGYLTSYLHLVLAEELYEQKLLGDEPEEIEVIPWRMDQLDELLKRDDFTEARSIAAMYMVRDIIHIHNSHGEK